MVCPFALSYCLSGGIFALSPLVFAFSFRAEHVSLPLLVALALLLWASSPFEEYGALFFLPLARGCCPASGHGRLRGGRQGIRGLRSPLPPTTPQPRVGEATRDGRSICSGSPLSAFLPRGRGRPFCRIYHCKAVESLIPHVSRTAFSYCSFFRWLAASARHPGVVACAAGDRMAARKGRDRQAAKEPYGHRPQRCGRG